MKIGGRILAALVALGLAALLVHAIVAPESAERRIPLTILFVVALVVFARPGSLWLLAVVVPVGPILDFFFLTPDRGIYATEVILLAAICSWLGNKAIGRDKTSMVKPNLPGWLLLGFGVVGTLALLIGYADTFNSFVTWRAFRVLLLAAGAVLVFRATVESSTGKVTFVWAAATLVALLLIALGGVVDFIIRAQGQFEAGSFYASSIGLAMHLAFFAPVALNVWLGPSQRKWRLLGAAAWGASLICLPLTASRGALGSFLITSVLAVLIMARRSRGRALQVMAFVLVALCVLLAILAARPDIAGEAFAYKFRATMAGDFFSTRVDAWSEAWQGIVAHPLVGEGPQTWSPSVPLELARRHGGPAALLGLGAIVTAAWVAGRRAWSLDTEGIADRSGLNPASLCWGLSLGLVGLFLVGLAETGLGARLTPLLTWVVVLVGWVAESRETGPVV